jgi:hypothetical protein
MRKTLAIVVVFVFLLLPEECWALSTADLFRRYSPSVATLIVTRKDGKASQGTGFLISSAGEVLTNFHVVDNAESVEVHFSKTLWYSAKRIVAQDPEKDLALLWVERVAPSLSYLQISPAKKPEGSDLVVIGTPRGFEKTVSTGILSGYRTYGPLSLIQITAPISSGSSGSPVFDTGGKVIGIAIGTLQNAQGLNFAVEGEEIAKFLRARPFKTPAETKKRTISSTTNGSLKNAREPVKQLSLPEILAKLEVVRPRTGIDQVRQKLGAPDKEDERSQGYYLRLWGFKSNDAILFVWDRDKVVERAEWVERYSTKEEADSRAKAMLALAAQSFGKHSASSQNGKTWKRGGYFVGIENHSVQDSHMVMFKATQQ